MFDWVLKMFTKFLPHYLNSSFGVLRHIEVMMRCSKRDAMHFRRREREGEKYRKILSQNFVSLFLSVKYVGSKFLSNSTVGCIKSDTFTATTLYAGPGKLWDDTYLAMDSFIALYGQTSWLIDSNWSIDWLESIRLESDHSAQSLEVNTKRCVLISMYELSSKVFSLYRKLFDSHFKLFVSHNLTTLCERETLEN